MTSSIDSSKMFHTFQGLAPPRPNSAQSQENPKPSTAGVSKRITTPHACAECKRRKIRCDGRQPCGQCLGCRSPKPCYYDKHRQRVIPSRKTLDALSQSLEECRTILKRLFPTQETQALLPLSRQELIGLIDRSGQQTALSQLSPIATGSNTSPLSQEFQSPIASNSDDDHSLANLEQMPGQNTEWDEVRRSRDRLPAEADDVNALSLSVDRQSSYLGASSIKAAFLVMLKVAPALREFLVPPESSKQVMANNHPTPRPANSAKTLIAISWSSDGQTLIDAYFNRVQVLVPMLDEPSFRADYLSGRRHDAPWLALLNMVFAMGSVAANKSDDTTHINYYYQAKEHLDIDTFGSGYLETLQALALMGGFYLHYINKPNMANAIMGAALRMACAMGLHRESILEQNTNTLLLEQRRRTWWSLFCLDTWASTTLGRPSMGRWGPGITIQSPDECHDSKSTGQNIGMIPIIENIKFCKISTQIQDMLAQAPLLRHEDRTILDNQLVAWHENLPWVLKSTEPCAESIHTARSVMKWRYQNMRVVLYRPVLLNLANRGNESSPSPDELAAVNRCRDIAKQTIEDIAREWTPNQMLGWNGVWFMYQASMIPLVSMFWESWNQQLVRDCQNQIELVLEAFEGLSDWSVAARTSRDVLLRLYEASKHPSFTSQSSSNIRSEAVKGENVERLPAPSTNGINGLTHMMNGHGLHGNTLEAHEIQSMEMMEDSMILMDQQGVWDLDRMLWAKLPNGMEIPFEGMPMDFNGVGYDGNYMMQQ